MKDQIPLPPPKMPGTIVPGYGKVEAVGMKDGERFYMFYKDDIVSLIPGPVIDKDKTENERKPDSDTKINN